VILATIRRDKKEELLNRGIAKDMFQSKMEKAFRDSGVTIQCLAKG
jgi:hypothetical protein